MVRRAWLTRTPRAAPGKKGTDDLRFQDLAPKKMTSFDSNAPRHLPGARAWRTFVVVRFEPVGDRATHVKLHHTAWGNSGEQDEASAYFDHACGNVLASLKERFDSGPLG